MPALQQCFYCGANLPSAEPAAPVMDGAQRCEHCGAVNAQSNTACRNCRRPLPVQAAQDASRPPSLAACPSCGAPNSETSEFCRLCGASMAAVPEPSATPAPAAAPEAAQEPEPTPETQP
ncbi:MAG: zinc-ribbon domain-containing protein, partial [Armatimonadia bacterium]|nr:zinc-ribbon domain-containing protein [Armatimonadia bacterium]